MEEIRSTIRPAYSFTEAEKIAIIEEYLEGNSSKTQIWRKYTGYKNERAGLLRWMRQLGYAEKPNYQRIFKRNSLATLSTSNKNPNPTDLELEIRQLKKELIDAKLKTEGLELMIEIAEKELKIPIRKKSDTK